MDGRCPLQRVAEHRASVDAERESSGTLLLCSPLSSRPFPSTVPLAQLLVDSGQLRGQIGRLLDRCHFPFQLRRKAGCKKGGAIRGDLLSSQRQPRVGE